MRIVKIALVALAFTITLSGMASAQDYLRCTDINQSTVDTVRINAFSGLPGDTAWMPVYMSTDSVLSGFKMLIKWDETYLTPAIYTDPQRAGLIAAKLEGRFLKTDTTTSPTSGNDTIIVITDFFAQISSNPFDSGAILAAYNLNLPPPDPGSSDSVGATYYTAPGSGIIFRLGFLVDENMPLGNTAPFAYHAVNEFYYDTTGGILTPIYQDCRRTDLALNFNDGTVTSYPRLVANVFTASEDITPTINSFTANPSSINSGQSSTLTWDVSNATSVSISPTVGTVSSSGTSVVSPTATTTYTLTAQNGTNSVQQGVTVTVDGSPPTGNPVITVNPSVFNYTIEQGETVTFIVNATDADNDVITLSATSKPNNSTFTTAIGAGSVSSTFSFTPDVTQSGTYQAVFGATDDGGGVATQVAVTITVNELQFDRLFTTSALGQAPSGGIAGKDVVFLPINLITSQVVYGFQYDFFYDHTLFTVDSVIPTTRTPDYVIYDDIGRQPGYLRVVGLGLANEPVINDDTTTAIIYTVFSIDSAAAPGDYPIYIDSGWESVDPDPNVPALPLVTDSGVIQVDYYGDVNLDRRVNVGDLVNVVAYIIGNFGLSERQFDVADVVLNGIVNVYDLVEIVNNIFGTPLSPAPQQQFEGEEAQLALEYNDVVAGGSDLMVVRSELPTEIAGAELEIRYDPSTVSMAAPKLRPDADQMALSYKDDGAGSMKVLLHYTSPNDQNAVIQSGFADLVEINMTARKDIYKDNKSQIRLAAAQLSTAAAESVTVSGIDLPLPSTFTLSQNYPNPFNPTTTIEFELGSASEVKLDVYNILGQNVITLIDGNMPAGAHRINWDAVASDGQRVATGVYLYKLQVNDASQTRKMLLLK